MSLIKELGKKAYDIQSNFNNYFEPELNHLYENISEKIKNANNSGSLSIDLTLGLDEIKKVFNSLNTNRLISPFQMPLVVNFVVNKLQQNGFTVWSGIDSNPKIIVISWEHKYPPLVWLTSYKFKEFCYNKGALIVVIILFVTNLLLGQYNLPHLCFSNAIAIAALLVSLFGSNKRNIDYENKKMFLLEKSIRDLHFNS